jgi:hypothetical protein
VDTIRTWLSVIIDIIPPIDPLLLIVIFIVQLVMLMLVELDSTVPMKPPIVEFFCVVWLFEVNVALHVTEVILICDIAVLIPYSVPICMLIFVACTVSVTLN